MASEWNLWVWLECTAVVSGRCCKEVWYIDILIIINTFPYSTFISFFFAAASLLLCSFKTNPSSTSKDDVKVNNRTYITITENLHSLEHSQFMGGSLAEYLGISSDVHTFFAVMHLPLVSIGIAYSFLTSLYAES